MHSGRGGLGGSAATGRESQEGVSVTAGSGRQGSVTGLADHVRWKGWHGAWWNIPTGTAVRLLKTGHFLLS